MISVVIPVFNEEKLISTCLRAFIDQTTKELFEIIIVDNNSTDESVNIIKKFRDQLPIKIVRQKMKGRGAARYKGFQTAVGDIIFSTDADSLVPPTWIEYLSHELRQSNAIAVTGPCKITDCDRLTNSIVNVVQPLLMRIYCLMFGHYWLSGFNFAIYKKAYEKSGGFNPKLNAQEDIELSFQASKTGKIKFISEMPVIFSGRRFRKGLLRGIVPYITTFIEQFMYKRDDIVLSDIR